MLVFWDHGLVGHPKIGKTVACTSLRVEWPPTSLGRSARFDLLRRKQPAFRVLRHSAIQIHAWFVFFSTNDQSSSNSRTLASGSLVSGTITVSFKAGSLAAFFYPCDYSIARNTKRSL